MIKVKKCTKCGEEKLLDQFCNNKNRPDGKQCWCKECMKNINYIYVQNNKEKISNKGKKYREENKETLKQKQKIYYKKNKEKIHVYKPNQTKMCSCCGQTKLIFEFSIIRTNPDGLNYYCKKCDYKRQKPRDIKRIEWEKNYEKEKLKNNTKFKLKKYIGNLIRNSFKKQNHIKKSKTIDILGCSIDEFKQHLEKQFESWMNWDNYGKYNGEYGYGWDIDHIIPISSAKTEEDILKLNHYTNLQPLDSFINRYIKKDLIIQCKKCIPKDKIDK